MRDNKNSRAAHAESILNDDAVRFALDAMRSEVITELSANPLRWYGRSSLKRDRLILSLQAINDFESRLRAYIRRAPG
jgi:hypothetical protein